MQKVTNHDGWLKLLDKVDNIPQEILNEFYDQEYFTFMGVAGAFGTVEQKRRFCTVDGLNQQLDSFVAIQGLLFYLNADTRRLEQVEFELTKEYYDHTCQYF